VIAAVPTRIPLVTAGVSGSYGMAFLFSERPDLPHLSSAILPFTFVDLMSISAKWIQPACRLLLILLLVLGSFQ
jgi:hypothetical protein